MNPASLRCRTACLLLLGTLLVHHVPAGWSAKRNRGSGIVMLSTLTWLAMTGYLLYYAGTEALRGYAAATHLWVGLAAAAIVGIVAFPIMSPAWVFVK